jgi:hypothetical protein
MGRFAWTTSLVGVLSFAFHATNNFATQLLDFIGMYVLAFLLLSLNLQRIGWLRRERVGQAHVGLTVGCTLAIPVMRHVRIPYQLVVLVAVLVIVGTEVVLSRRADRRESYRDFWLAVALMALAAAFSVVDVARVWCEPDNHWMQGHALWHVSSALALLFTARHHARLEGPGRALGVPPVRSP